MNKFTDERLHDWADYFCTGRDDVCSDDDHADDDLILCEHALARALLAARVKVDRLAALVRANASDLRLLREPRAAQIVEEMLADILEAGDE